jgi:hypothetical protein
MTTTGKCYPYLWVIMESRINSQPCKGINLTTRHTRARRAPRVATVHNAVKEMIRAHLNLVHVFHVYASTDKPWVAHALSHFTPVSYGRIASVSATHKATQFVGPHKILYAPVHNSNLLIGARWSTYHLEALNFRSDHSSSIPSSILLFPLFAPPGLQLFQSSDHLAKPHRTSIDRKGPIASKFLPLIFYW